MKKDAESVLLKKQKEIQTRYARDRQTMNEKLNELYAENGVSTTAGCLPLSASSFAVP